MTDNQSLPLHHLSSRPRQAPPAGKRPPLLLLLHGVGSHEYDLFELAPYLDPRFQILSLRAPNTLVYGSYAWFDVQFTAAGSIIQPDQAEVSRQKLVAFVEQAPAAYEADPQQVYLIGFSQGAIMSLAVLLTRPDLLAGVVAMSGRTLPELFADNTPLSGNLAPAQALEEFPLLVIHGDQDQVLPVAHGRATQDRFSILPVDLTYKEYPMPHSISEASLNDVVDWLAARLDDYEG